ncbi:hypothetical protein BGX27_006458 [Mortierella sp. AM989]|nr:hypothetical protein BGX27_006458 [Mortierella sp. AM989]
MDSTPASQVLSIPEIFSMIIDLLKPGCLKSASLVCKDWHRHTRLILWRQLVVPKDWYNTDLTQLWPVLDRQGSAVMTLNLELTDAERLNHNADTSLIKIRLGRLLLKLPNLESLHIQFPHGTKSNIVLTIAEHATQLKQLDTDIKDWDTDDMTVLLATCPNLRHITGHNFTGKVLQAIAAAQPLLDGIGCTHPRFDDDEMISFAQQFPNLLQLSVSFHQFLTSKALISLAMHCQKIEQLEFHFCLCLQSDGFQAAFRAFNNLRILNLGPSEVHDDDIALVSTHCPNLEVLKLPFCSNITHVSILAIVHSCRGLQHLDISWCDKVLLSIFNQEIPWVCSDLRYLDISGINASYSIDTSMSLEFLRSMYHQLSILTRLQHLILSGYEFSLRLLEVGGPYLAQLERLETLNISKLKTPISWNDMIRIGNLFLGLKRFQYQNSDVLPLSDVERAAIIKSDEARANAVLYKSLLPPPRDVSANASKSTTVTSLWSSSPASTSALDDAAARESSKHTPKPASPKRERSQSPSPPLTSSTPSRVIPSDLTLLPLPRQSSVESIIVVAEDNNDEGEENAPITEVISATLISGLEIFFHINGEEKDEEFGGIKGWGH